MQVTLEKDAEGLLGLPYGGPETPLRRFWNLDEHPEVIDNIPEISDYPQLKEFLCKVAAPSIHFCTFGCEKWSKKVDYGSWITHESGLYVDFAFSYIELATDKDNYLKFVDEVKKHGQSLNQANAHSDLALIRFEPKRAVINATGTRLWILTGWLHGVGNCIQMANNVRDYALRQLFVCMKKRSTEIDRVDLAQCTRVLAGL
jgi:hypothetical protein